MVQRIQAALVQDQAAQTHHDNGDESAARSDCNGRRQPTLNATRDAGAAILFCFCHCGCGPACRRGEWPSLFQLEQRQCDSQVSHIAGFPPPHLHWKHFTASLQSTLHLRRSKSRAVIDRSVTNRAVFHRTVIFPRTDHIPRHYTRYICGKRILRNVADVPAVISNPGSDARDDGNCDREQSSGNRRHAADDPPAHIGSVSTNKALFIGILYSSIPSSLVG
jgi:hypothetical protein